MNDETTPQDGKAMSPASAGSLAWIPVTERLPDEDDEVLVAWGLSVDVAIFRDRRWFRIPQELTKITHWMPLPAPPTDAQ